MERFKLSLKGREKLSYIVVLVIFLSLSSGLVKLQVIEHPVLLDRSKKNRRWVAPILPQRGVVYDRNGQIIIDNRPSYTVSVVPAEEVSGVTLPLLANLLKLDSIQIRKRIKKNMVSRYQQTPVKRDVPFEIVAVLEEQNIKFPGVTYQMEQVRKYNPELGAESFAGYVGEVSVNELNRLKRIDPELYHLGSIIGKKGLEKQYDLLLRGREGTEYIEVTASGKLLGQYKDEASQQAVPGVSLILTLDNELQKACLQALDTFCCGAIVALDPRNGELLAMTSYPGYDANIFSSVIPESLWQAIRSDSTHPLLNRPLSGLYPPGSTVKFVTIGAGLEEGIISANSTFQSCMGGKQFGNRFFRCWLPGGHGSLDAVQSLEQSCDVYIYQLGMKLGVDRLSKYYGMSGFGSQTNIDLPAEAPGINPNSIYYDTLYGINKWSRMLVLNLAIGQGELLVTPLQLAQFFCGLANDGVVYQPHVVWKITHPSRAEIIIHPKVSFHLPFSQKTLNVLKEGMRLVVEGEKGTARKLKNERYAFGGKTGTAENPHGENHSWFVGVAPMDNPEIVVCAIVENAGHGSDIAAPMVGQIIDFFMRGKDTVENITIAPDGDEN